MGVVSSCCFPSRRPDCDEPSDDATRFDYHTASKSSGFNVAFKYTPGRGYGGDVRPVGAGPAVSQMGRVPARHASPDNDVVGPDVAHHATGRHEGVPS